MRGLAPIGIVMGLALAGCPTSHATVRSCAEAMSAPDGTPCEGFTDCSSCMHTLVCSGGVLTSGTNLLLCDGGGWDAAPLDAGTDAGIPLDAGPCAPRPPATGTPCRTTGDCNTTHFEMCYAPGASPPGCGICVMAMHTCVTDADCASTDYCESYREPCAVPGLCGNGSDVTSTRCVPRCSASSCGAGESCGTDGRCTPVSCVGGGYTCPAHTTCGDTAGGDAHGCHRDACTVDADCGCGGACLMGLCYDTLGTCIAPAA